MIIRIFANQLVHTLKQQTYPAYLLVGQDPLLIEESKAQLFQFGKQQGATQKQEIIIDSNTDWATLFTDLQTFGLFSQQQIFLFTLPDNINAQLQQQLQQLVSLLHSDIIAIFQIARLTTTIEKQAWFKTLEQLKTLQINCQTPTLEQLPQWIQQRAKMMELSIDNEAVELLAYNYENNLAALKQTLQLMQLLYPQQKITLINAGQCIEQSAVFTPFQWIDAILQGKKYRCIRILEQLQNEGDVQPVVLLRILQKELLLLLRLGSDDKIKIENTQQMLNSQLLRQKFDQYKIWKNRRPLYSAAIQRLNYHRLYDAIQHLTAIEKAIKQQGDENSWQALQQLTVKLAA